jgi:hypothetical protein
MAEIRKFWVLRDGGAWPDEVECVGETSRSWIDNCGYKYAKRQYRVISAEEAELVKWASKHRTKIANQIGWWGSCTPEMLRKVADIIGFKEQSP